MLEFKKISVSDKEVYDRYRKKNPTPASEGVFTTMFIWNAYYNLETAHDEEFFYIKFSKKGKPAEFFFPIGDGDIKKAVDKLFLYCESMGIKLNFALTDEKNAQKLKSLYPEKFVYENDADCADYVYLTEKMINLSGKKLHAKKNHLNYFQNNYRYQYEKVAGGALLEKCALRAYEIVEGKEKNQNPYELGAMHAYFENYSALEQKGGAILVDGEIAAMTFGERLTDDTALIQIELADERFRGAYQCINKLFLENEWSDTVYVNREEDMGIEGLRKAKQSYHPEFMIDKYFIKEV